MQSQNTKTKFTIKPILLILFFSCFIPNFAFSATYEMIWNYKGLNIEVTTEQGTLSEVQRVSENGILSKGVVLPTIRSLHDNKITLGSEDTAVIYLFVKNLEKSTLRFSVAPHGTDPAESALGFHFNCLCNGHIYEVPPGKTWYRIMRLQVESASESSVKLKHEIFRVSKKTGKRPSKVPN